MLKFQVLCLLTVGGSSLVAGCGQGAREEGPQVLEIPAVMQETRMWCSASSVEMILSHLGRQVTQCEQVNRILEGTDCCADAPPRECWRGGWPQFEAFGFASEQTDSSVALSWERLRGEIDSDRPVAFSWNWRKGGSHMLVAVGYAEPNWVYVNDPWPANGDFSAGKGQHKIITYEEFVSGANHTHWRDYYEIRPEGTQITRTDEPVAVARRGLPRAGRTPAEAAGDALGKLYDLIAENNYRSLGFAAYPGKGSLRLGQSLPVYNVGLDDCKNYHADTGARDLFSEVAERVYPVLVGGEERSSVRVRNSAGRWEVVGFGHPRWTRASAVQRKLAAGAQGAERDYFIVDIPALYLCFVGWLEGDVVQLAPVRDDFSPQDPQSPAREALDSLYETSVLPFDGDLKQALLILALLYEDELAYAL